VRACNNNYLLTLIKRLYNFVGHFHVTDVAMQYRKWINTLNASMQINSLKLNKNNLIFSHTQYFQFNRKCNHDIPQWSIVSKSETFASRGHDLTRMTSRRVHFAINELIISARHVLTTFLSSDYDPSCQRQTRVSVYFVGDVR